MSTDDDYRSPIRGIVFAFVPSVLAWAGIIALIRWLAGERCT